MTEIKWEVGKTYKTRDGYDAFIYSIYPEQPYGVHGAVFNGTWISQKWQFNGNFIAHKEHSYDLMPSGPDTHVGWVNVYGDRRGSLYPTREFADAVAHADRIACIRIEWKDGQFDD